MHTGHHHKFTKGAKMAIIEQRRKQTWPLVGKEDPYIWLKIFPPPKTNEKYKVRFLVVKEDLTPLLGLNATQKMKLLTVHKENFINVVENANDDLTANYADVFNKGLGTLPGKVTLQVDPDCLLSF